ncbi:MAG: membrane protein insertase YidC, partial [Burkholderiales bacterium]|nr:membrane protein insertase YidC [Burkholderiales bacterium]
MYTEIKRNILWVVFLTSLFFLWDNWNVSQGNASFFAPAPKTTATSGQNAGVPSASSATATAAAIANGSATPAFKSETITITTDIFKADIDTLGGEIKRLELLNYRDGIDSKKNQLLFDKSANHTYLAQSGLIGKGEDGVALPNHKSGFTAKPGIRELTNGANEVQLVLETESAGVKLSKTFTFKRGDYTIGIKHELHNNGKAAISPSLYLQLVHDGNKPADDTYFTSSYTGPSLYTDEEKFQKLEFSKIENGKVKHANSTESGWIAIVQHFFVSAYLPPEKLKREIRTEKVDTNLYSIANVFALGNLAPGASTVFDTR